MSVTWNTKFGGRRVRQEPPTLAEALIAAESMSDDEAQQIEIAASLLSVDAEEIREAALRIRRRPERSNRLSIAAPRRMEAPRTVVVEYKTRRSVRQA